MPNSTRPKKWRRRILGCGPVALTVRAAERKFGPRSNDGLVVAMFHETHSAERFNDQLDALLEGRQAVRGADVVDALAGRSELPEGAVWITFDDAYGDFYDVAWPVLERRGLPVTQFVATGFVGSAPASFWWDRLHAAFMHTQKRSIELRTAQGETIDLSLASRGVAWKRARAQVKGMPHAQAMDEVERLIASLDAPDEVVDTRVMSWEEIRELMARGLEVGGHTRNHPMLDQLSAEDAAEEVARGFSELREQLVTVLPVFAYPSGQYCSETMDAVRSCGIDVAVTTDNGVNRMGELDPMQIQRVPIGPLADGTAVRLRLLLALRA